MPRWAGRGSRPAHAGHEVREVLDDRRTVPCCVGANQAEGPRRGHVRPRSVRLETLNSFSVHDVAAALRTS